MVKVKKNLSGMKFGKLTVIEQVEDSITPKGQHLPMWKCICDCGTEIIIEGGALKPVTLNHVAVSHEQIETWSIRNLVNGL